MWWCASVVPGGAGKVGRSAPVDQGAACAKGAGCACRPLAPKAMAGTMARIVRRLLIMNVSSFGFGVFQQIYDTATNNYCPRPIGYQAMHKRYRIRQCLFSGPRLKP